ncbi:esterase [Gemmatimonadetes bacterium T265]|nr:esterase [Gemmatimonadetes bacterium T265]
MWVRRARRAAWGAAALGAAFLALRVVWPALVVAAPRTETRTLVVGGRARSYRLHHPEAWDPEQPLPLVLAFHGHTATGRTMEYESGLDAAADRARVLVAYPDGVSRVPALARVPLVGPALAGLTRTWNVGACCAPASTDAVDDVAFAAAVVRTLAADGSVDPARVYATGFSIGGTLALKLACDRAGLVAAVASIEGTMPDVACAPPAPTPVWLVRGGEDAELRADLAENRGQGGSYRFAESMRVALAFWARRNACAGPVVRHATARVATEAYAGCPGALAAAQLLVHGNAHAWPGGRRPWLLAPRPAPGVPLSRWLLTFFLAHGGAPTR